MFFSSKNSLSASKNSPGRNLKIHGRSKNSRWIDPHFPGPPFDRPGPARPAQIVPDRPRPAGPRSPQIAPDRPGRPESRCKVRANNRHRQQAKPLHDTITKPIARDHIYKARPGLQFFPDRPRSSRPVRPPGLQALKKRRKPRKI